MIIYTLLIIYNDSEVLCHFASHYYHLFIIHLCLLIVYCLLVCGLRCKVYHSLRRVQGVGCRGDPDGLYAVNHLVRVGVRVYDLFIVPFALSMIDHFCGFTGVPRS